MKIDLYTCCYNDEDFLPFFLDYYLKIVNRITFVDNGSTDRTLEIIKEAATKDGPVIRLVHSGMTFWDWDFGLVIRNTIWKHSKYDVIMWADLDEIIYKPNLRQFLETTNYDIYQTKGYDMVSKEYPQYGVSILDIRKGTPAYLEDKYLIWRRDVDITSVTAHSIEPTSASICRGEIKCLHYKYLGVNAMLKRAAAIKARVPADSYCEGIKGNILKKYPGFIQTENQYRREINRRLQSSIRVI